MLPWQPTNSHTQLSPPPLLFLLLRLLSNIQEGLYWNNNSILSLAEKIWRGEFIELHELLPSRLTTPEPTVLDLLSSREKSTPKKTISTIQEWATCFNSYISLIWVRQPACVPDLPVPQLQHKLGSKNAHPPNDSNSSIPPFHHHASKEPTGRIELIA